MNTQERIGRYQVLEEVGSGGQATVYRVWDTETRKILALKRMHPHLSRDSSYVERFQREAGMASSLKHPNVIPIFEVGEEAGSHFMSMEYLPDSLHQLIQAHGRLPIDQAVNFAHQVCQGLQAAHERGIIHRDIKPQNILLAPDGTAKITDFGIARATELPTMTRTGMVLGTPHYMSPEQAQGDQADIRSDIYAVGILLHQMLTGDLPFNADTPLGILRQHIEVAPPSVREARADVPPQVESIVARCLRKDRSQRYQTPQDLAFALEQAVPDVVRRRQRPRAATAPAPPPPATAASRASQRPATPTPPSPPRGTAAGRSPDGSPKHPFLWGLGMGVIGVALLLVVIGVLAGREDMDSGRPVGAPAATAVPGATATEQPVVVLPPKERPNTLVLAYDGWTGTYLPTYVLKAIFEDELGYTVQIVDQATIPAAFESVASGQTDIFTSAWFPARDSSFEEYTNLVKLGQVYGGKAKDAFEGWMVPAEFSERFNVTHVGDLNNREVARALDTDGDGKGNLIGCPPDWTCAKRNPEILQDYELTELYEIDAQGSEQELLRTIETRFRQGQPALFYMHQPVVFPGDVPVMDRSIWLEGTEAYLPLAFDRTITRSDFIVNHPEAARVLNEYKISGVDIGWAMGEIAKKGASPEFVTQLAQVWINGHRAEVDSWLEGISERSLPPSPPPEALTIAYSPEKEDLFLKLVIEFNLSRPPTVPPVHPIRLEMADMLKDAVDGEIAAMSPDSSIWLDTVDRMWQKRNPGAPPLVGDTTRYAVSPIVIAMWQSKVAELAAAAPDEGLRGLDLLTLVLADPTFKWSHTSVKTASGLLVTTGEFYAGAGKLTELTIEDVEAEETLGYVRAVESTVERYGGESEDKVVIRMLAEGGHPLDAFVAQEQLVVYFNRNAPGDKLVAFYPPEGTFWMDHPLVLLNGPWVTERQKSAFGEFARFVVEPNQKRLMLSEGYRFEEGPVPQQVEGSLIVPEYGVNPTEPQTVLEIPAPEVLDRIREVWRLVKKPADIYLVVDVSGSMSGAKLASAKNALNSFVDQVQGSRDRVALVAFSSKVYEIQGLAELDPESFKASIGQLEARGGTFLYDAVAYAYDGLLQQADPERISVIVAMTDGVSSGDIGIVESKVREATAPVLIFTVAYGAGADLEVLQRIARLGDGQVYPSDPETIEKLYELLSAFF